MQYRYSRGQTGQGSLPRPAWGSGGNHGARATSPEPGGSSSAPLANGGEASKERLASNQDEVILQLENELMELRSACAWKDQRIAELSRTDTPAGRLKRDVRLLAAELHQTRKQLSESLGEAQELQQQLGREAGAGGPAARDLADSPSADAIASGAGASRGGSSGASRDSERSLRESIGQLQEENRQLKDTVARLQMAPAHEGLHHARQPSGASSQRSEPPPQAHLPGQGAAVGGGLAAGGYRSSDPGPFPPRGGYLAQGPGQAAVASHEEQVVYSTVHTENTATLGPQTLQGIGTVDGVASVAKVLLSRIHSSVCAAHRRPVSAAMPAPPGQPLQPGQIPMVMMGMPQGM